MKWKHRQQRNKALRIIGAVLITIPNGVLWYWGNLSILTLSYILFHVPSDSGIETPWVASLYIVFRSLGVITFDLCKKICGRGWNTIIGIMMSDVAVVSCYFAVQNSLILLNVALGVVLGFGSGLLYGQALKTVVDIGGSYKEFLMCLVQGSFATGGMIVNEFVTLYANPSNVSPDFKRGFSMYFSQKSVLDNVPSIYLFVGLFSIVVHGIAFILLNQTVDVRKNGERDSNDRENQTTYNENTRKTEHDTRATIQTDSSDSIHAADASNDLGNNPKDYSPAEVLKTALFYALWISFFILDFPFLLIGNYYKSVGQIWIHDDHFLTYLGTSIIFANTWVRGFWGVVFDKCKLETSVFLVFTPCLLLNTWCSLTPMVSRWLYLFSTVFWSSLTGATYSLFTSIIALTFGKTHFTINFGLLSTASLVFNIGGPVLIEAIISRFGWFAMYLTSAILNAICFIALLIFV